MKTMTRRALVDDVADFWSRQSLEGDIATKRLTLKMLLVGMALNRENEDWCRARFDLSRGELAVLMAVRRAAAEGIRPTDLFISLSMSSAGVTKQLKVLEGRGLVAREGDPRHRRGFLVRLSPEGQAIADAAHTAIDATGPVAEALSGLAPGHRAQVERALDILLSASRESAVARKSRARAGTRA